MEFPSSESQNEDHKGLFVSVDYIICECGETFPTKNELSKHLETKHSQTESKEFKCGLCNMLFLTETACVQHHQNSHTVTIIKPPQPTMKYIIQPLNKKLENTCDKTITKKCSGIHQGEQRKGVVVRKKPAVRTFECDLCGKTCQSKPLLENHRRRHTGEKPFECQYCHKRFRLQTFLQLHIRIHTGEKPFKCTVCAKAFTNRTGLNTHFRVHTGEKPYACQMCDKAFAQSSTMKQHVKAVHLKQPAPYRHRKPKLVF